MSRYIYAGWRVAGKCYADAHCEDGSELTSHLDARFDLINHSPTGFEWGYTGSGPAQLALAILSHHCNSDDERVLRWYQQFKAEVVARFPYDQWTIDSKTVERWLREKEERLAVIENGSCRGSC